MNAKKRYRQQHLELLRNDDEEDSGDEMEDYLIERDNTTMDVEEAKEVVVRNHRNDEQRSGIKALCYQRRGYYDDVHLQLVGKVEALQTQSAELWKSCNDCAKKVGCDARECLNMDCSHLFKRNKVESLLKSNRVLLSTCEANS